MTTVEIQRPDGRGGWQNVPVSNIIHKKNQLVVGGKFRILVDDEVVYPREETDDYVMLEKEEVRPHG